MDEKPQKSGTRRRNKANHTVSLLEDAEKHLAFARALIDAAERADNRTSKIASHWTNLARNDVIGAESYIDMALRALQTEQKEAA